MNGGLPLLVNRIFVCNSRQQIYRLEEIAFIVVRLSDCKLDLLCLLLVRNSHRQILPTCFPQPGPGGRALEMASLGVRLESSLIGNDGVVESAEPVLRALFSGNLWIDLHGRLFFVFHGCRILPRGIPFEELGHLPVTMSGIEELLALHEDIREILEHLKLVLRIGYGIEICPVRKSDLLRGNRVFGPCGTLDILAHQDFVGFSRKIPHDQFELIPQQIAG